MSEAQLSTPEADDFAKALNVLGWKIVQLEPDGDSENGPSMKIATTAPNGLTNPRLDGGDKMTDQPAKKNCGTPAFRPTEQDRRFVAKPGPSSRCAAAVALSPPAF